MSSKLLTAVLAAGFWLLPVSADAAQANATIRDRSGKTVGVATLISTPNGTLITAEFGGLPPGWHAFHIHAVGKCVPPFTSAGGHYNPTGDKHGILVEGGPHAGDMPNIHQRASGPVDIQVLNTKLVLDARLFDADGAAIVLHAKADDYKSQPAGDAGDRIACGVIVKY